MTAHRKGRLGRAVPGLTAHQRDPIGDDRAKVATPSRSVHETMFCRPCGEWCSKDFVAAGKCYFGHPLPSPDLTESRGPAR